MTLQNESLLPSIHHEDAQVSQPLFNDIVFDADLDEKYGLKYVLTESKSVHGKNKAKV